ncbi:MAG: hypothetical protein LC754_18250 [Acidobacteria bacterium]|nr:hypothetical protein [Acidobacteriota bacterium]
MEFDLFEDVRLSLTRILVKDGRDPVEAERVALYVVQGIRDVPKLLTALANASTKDDADVHKLLHVVLDNAASLEKARAILLGLDNPPLH